MKEKLKIAQNWSSKITIKYVLQIKSKIITITTFTKSTIMELHWVWYSNGGFSTAHHSTACVHTRWGNCVSSFGNVTKNQFGSYVTKRDVWSQIKKTHK